MGASPSRKRAVLDSLFGSGSPTNWYVGAALVLPSDDGTGWVEVSGNNYGRALLVNNTTNWPAATSAGPVTSKKNATKATHPNPSGNWGNIVGYMLFTAASGGSPEFWNPNDTTIGPRSGNTPVEYDVNQLIITL